MVLCVGLYYYRLIRSQHRQWFSICLPPVCYEQIKGLRPTKLFLSHKWHSRVNSEVRTIVEVKAAPIEWATRQSWCHICGIEWWQTHARTRSEDKDQVRVWMIALEHYKNTTEQPYTCSNYLVLQWYICQIIHGKPPWMLTKYDMLSDCHSPGMRSHFSLVVNQSCPVLIARPWVLFSIWIK